MPLCLKFRIVAKKHNFLIKKILFQSRLARIGLTTVLLLGEKGVGGWLFIWVGVHVVPTNVVTLVDAKKKVIELHSQVLSGTDPREKAKKTIPTFTEFFYEHYLPQAKSRKRTWKKDEEIFRVRLQKALGDKKLNQITRQQIQTLHMSIKDAGFAGATADHGLKLCRQILNLAVDYGYLENNPASGVKQFNIDNRQERYLSEIELQRLLKVLQTDTNRTVCNIALLLLCTGQRLSSALMGRRVDIDREHRVWRIPASNSKSKKVHSVPLNDAALKILDNLDTEGKHEYLFINHRTGKPYTTIHKVWNRLRNDAELSHLRLHDLRHSYASFLVNSGRTLYEVQQVLQHSDPKVSSRYAHLSTKTLQEAANTVSDIISKAMPK